MSDSNSTPAVSKKAKTAPAPVPAPAAVTPATVARAIYRKGEGVTVTFTDQALAFKSPKRARKWLRLHGLTVKNTAKDTNDPHRWSFAIPAPTAKVAKEEEVEAAEAAE